MSAHHQPGAAPQDPYPWRRTHPGTLISTYLNILVGGVVTWLIFTIAVTTTLNEVGVSDTIATWLFIVFIVGGLVLGALMMILIGLGWRSWKFRVTDEAVEIRFGVLGVRHRVIRLDRIQAVDIELTLFGRIFGLSKVLLETADGASETAADISLLTHFDAEHLRREILWKASGAVPASPAADATLSGQPAQPSQPKSFTGFLDNPGGRGPLAEEQLLPMVRVPFRRLVGSSLLKMVPAALLWLICAAILGILIVGTVELAGGPATELSVLTAGIYVVVVFLALLGMAFGAVRTGVNLKNFTIYHSTNGLKITYGVTSTVSQTLPPGRVAGVGIGQSWLWRRRGWYPVEINAAGYGKTSDDENFKLARTIVLPVGTFDDVLKVLSIVTPHPGITRAPEVVKGGLSENSGNRFGFVNSPSRSRIFQPFQYARHGFTLTPTLLLLRAGRYHRTLSIIPHDRIVQTALSQGPWQRRLGLADARFVTVDGPVSTALPHMDATVAAELVVYESHVASFARRYADRNQWMQPEDLHSFNQATADAHHALESGDTWSTKATPSAQL